MQTYSGRQYYYDFLLCQMGHRKIWKSGEAGSIVVGIICPYVGIGSIDLLKSGGGDDPPAHMVPTALTWIIWFFWSIPPNIFAYWDKEQQSKAQNLDSKYRQMALVGFDT